MQPEDDHTLAPGVRCWVTGNAANSGQNIGTADVDNGTTVLQSALFDLSAVPNPVVSYWRWYSNDAGSDPGTDTLRVDISNNGGASWTVVEKLVQSMPQWVEVTVPVASLVAPTNQMRMRFIAEDLGMGSVVEAAIDDFMAYGSGTAPTDAPPAAVHATRLYANVPNPFNPSTTLRFELAAAGPATLAIFDVRGGVVRTLFRHRSRAGCSSASGTARRRRPHGGERHVPRALAGRARCRDPARAAREVTARSRSRTSAGGGTRAACTARCTA